MHLPAGSNIDPVGLGKRIVDLQTSLGLLHRKDGTFVGPPDQYEREPFRHPVVDLLPRLTERARSQVANTSRIAYLGRRSDIHKVLRWKPKMVSRTFRNPTAKAWGPSYGSLFSMFYLLIGDVQATNLTGSGQEQVTAQAVYAIIGAVALQRGGEVVNRIVKDRILAPLGLH